MYLPCERGSDQGVVKWSHGVRVFNRLPQPVVLGLRGGLTPARNYRLLEIIRNLWRFERSTKIHSGEKGNRDAYFPKVQKSRQKQRREILFFRNVIFLFFFFFFFFIIAKIKFIPWKNANIVSCSFRGSKVWVEFLNIISGAYVG